MSHENLDPTPVSTGAKQLSRERKESLISISAKLKKIIDAGDPAYTDLARRIEQARTDQADALIREAMGD